MKIVVYTANLNHYDEFIGMTFPAGWDAIAYVDQHRAIHAHHGWHNIRPIVAPGKLEHRRIKAMPHRYLPDHDVSIWIDSNIRVMDWTMIKTWVHGMKGTDNRVVVMEHPDRKTLAEEIDAVIRLKKDTADRVRPLLHLYGNTDVVATGIVIRRNTPMVNAFNEMWWREIECASHRDQLSICHVAGRTGIIIGQMPWLPGCIKFKHIKQTK